MPISTEQEKYKKAIEKIISRITMPEKPGIIDANRLNTTDFDSIIWYLEI